MAFKNNYTKFSEAIRDNDYIYAENIYSYSDCREALVKSSILINGKDLLLEICAKFKSTILKENIIDLCEKYSTLKRNKYPKVYKKIQLTHEENKKKNLNVKSKIKNNNELVFFR